MPMLEMGIDHFGKVTVHIEFTDCKKSVYDYTCNASRTKEAGQRRRKWHCATTTPIESRSFRTKDWRNTSIVRRES
ncbi:jg18907 [Pararge aegeria aegeria]|uniref:Jg18907 protein n=1 Tax=Pararge aegeria aegeria TaxID=348720 RepID=A0A8S4QXT8_9NEOP|nr:jg18907 [Pararge aegeria aegeria]